MKIDLCPDCAKKALLALTKPNNQALTTKHSCNEGSCEVEDLCEVCGTRLVIFNSYFDGWANKHQLILKCLNCGHSTVR